MLKKKSRYVGKTDRHLAVHFIEHLRAFQPFWKYIRECYTSVEFDDKTAVPILHTNHKSIPHLMTLEALYQHQKRIQTNTRANHMALSVQHGLAFFLFVNSVECRCKSYSFGWFLSFWAFETVFLVYTVLWKNIVWRCRYISRII